MSTSFVLKKPSPKTRTFFYPFHTTRCWTNHLTSAETKISNNLNTNNEDFLEKKKKKNEHRHKLHICGVASTLQKSIASLIKDSDKDTLRHSALKIFDSLRSTSGYLLNNTATNSNIPTWSLAHPNQKLTPHHVAYDPNLILAYLATRLPHHYVAITRVLQEVFKKLPDFHPQSIFDFGTGPGTAIWALRNSLLPWAHSPVTAMDINPHMLEMAKLIAKETLHESSPIEFLEYLPISLEPQFDLTIASFVFSEIENKSIFKKSIESIWNMTKEILVVVDRGTPSGSQRILEIRNTLLHFKNATMIAPCPHSLECPLRNNTRDWCHFSQKMQRTPEMKKTKNSQHKGEDIKYSYLIVRKGSSQQVPESCTWSRVLTVPIKRKGHTILDVCMKEGQVSRGVVTHHEGKEIYKTVRKLGWGDQFPYPLSVVWEQRGLEREIHVKKKKETFDQKEKHAVKEIIEPSGSDSIRDNQNQKNHMRVKLGVKESPGDS